MLYLTYPQPYGSELSVDVKCGFWSSVSRSLNPDTWANLCFPMRRVSQLDAWFSKIGFPEQLLVNLTIRVPAQPAQEREPSRRRPWHQGPGDVDCRWNLFSMYGRPLGK